MIKNYNMYYRGTLLVSLLFGLLFIGPMVSATSVDQMALTNLEGYPGKTIKQEISLEGTDAEEKSGFWYTRYKEVENDSERMDISSWITIEPTDYTIKPGETKVFTVEVKIPGNAGPGLWGATSEEAAQEGHANERRTYIVFKDAMGEGNVYSGLLLPISVNVLPSPNPLVPVLNFIQQNIMIIVLSFVIIILLTMLSLKKRRGR